MVFAFYTVSVDVLIEAYVTFLNAFAVLIFIIGIAFFANGIVIFKSIIKSLKHRHGD